METPGKWDLLYFLLTFDSASIQQVWLCFLPHSKVDEVECQDRKEENFIPSFAKTNPMKGKNNAVTPASNDTIVGGPFDNRQSIDRHSKDPKETFGKFYLLHFFTHLTLQAFNV